MFDYLHFNLPLRLPCLSNELEGVFSINAKHGSYTLHETCQPNLSWGCTLIRKLGRLCTLSVCVDALKHTTRRLMSLLDWLVDQCSRDRNNGRSLSFNVSVLVTWLHDRVSKFPRTSSRVSAQPAAWLGTGYDSDERK